MLLVYINPCWNVDGIVRLGARCDDAVADLYHFFFFPANVLRVCRRRDDRTIPKRTRSYADTGDGDAVLTSFTEAQENMIDVLPLDAAVVSRQVVSVF